MRSNLSSLALDAIIMERAGSVEPTNSMENGSSTSALGKGASIGILEVETAPESEITGRGLHVADYNRFTAESPGRARSRALAS